MGGTENSFLQKILRVLLIDTPFLFTLFYIPGFMFSGDFPRTIFLYTAVSIIVIIWLICIYKSGTIVFKKNWINKAVLGYVLVLFISALAGGHFEQSFFGSVSRMTGIATMLYISGWYLIASSVLQPRDWAKVFRVLLLSGSILAVVSFLGVNGFNLKIFSYLNQGGSLFLNNTFSGIYYLLAFFFGVILFFQEQSRKWRIAYLSAMFVILINPDIFNFQILQNPGLLKDILENPTIVLGTARTSSAVVGIGIIFTAMMYIVHRTQISVRIKGILFSVVLLGLVASSVGFVWSVIAQKGPGADLFMSQNDIHRPAVWRQSVGGVFNKPLLGYGINNFEYAFQDTLSPDISFIAGANWLDKAHNIWLDLLLETGIAGTLSVIILFVLVCREGFKQYRNRADFSILVVALLLVLHFLQIQTSFNTVVSLFMIFLLFAYISSLSLENISYNISRRQSTIILFTGVIIIIAGMIFAVIIPVAHSYRQVDALTSGNFEKRLSLYESARSIYGYPAEPVYAITKQYMNALWRERELFNDKKALPGIALEFNKMLDLFESHYEQYNDNLRYHLNYVNMIFIARLFEVDRLDRAGELIARAKELSTAAPQVFWLSALHAKYTGDEDLAMIEIEKAVGLFASIDGRYDESLLGKFHSVSLKLRKFLEDTKGSKEKAYFHIKTI